MKLSDLFVTLNENFGDDLRKGFTREEADRVDSNVSVGDLSASYTFNQDIVSSPVKSFKDSPDEQETYRGDAISVIINSITYDPLQYTLHDLEYQVDFDRLDDQATVAKFYNDVIMSYTSDMDDNEQYTYKTKILPHITQDMIKSLFLAIKDDSDNLETGMM